MYNLNTYIALLTYKSGDKYTTYVHVNLTFMFCWTIFTRFLIIKLQWNVCIMDTLGPAESVQIINVS